MRELSERFFIKEEDLDQRRYFGSLIESAMRIGMLSDSDIKKIYVDLWQILKAQAEKRVGGKSSSIPKERAEELLESIAFVIGVRLKSFLTPEEAISKIQDSALRSLFEEGMELVRMKMANAKRLQNKILGNIFYTPNIFYRATISDGINGFFKLYKPQFSAQDIHITADYPVFLERPNLEGVEFIERYLRYIEAENSFLTLFDPGHIHRLMCAVKKDYAQIPMNFFEPVFMEATGNVILGKNPKELSLSAEDIQKLKIVFTDKTTQEIALILNDAITHIKLSPRSENYAALAVFKMSEWIKQCMDLKDGNGIFTAVDTDRRILDA